MLNLSHRQLTAIHEGKILQDHDVALQKVQQWNETFENWFAVYVHSASNEDVTNLLPMVCGVR